MPIKPENRARYPANWPEIRDSILERAGGHCEWPGCPVANYEVGFWTKPRYGLPKWHSHSDGALDSYQAAYQFAANAQAEDEEADKLIVIVLTVAHLDHTPENCDPANLAAWCQQHHLAYDQAHHRANAYMTRRERANTLELPL